MLNNHAAAQIAALNHYPINQMTLTIFQTPTPLLTYSSAVCSLALEPSKLQATNSQHSLSRALLPLRAQRLVALTQQRGRRLTKAQPGL